MLDALFELNNANTDAEKQAYLTSLKIPAKNLWDAYRNEKVSVNYSDRLTQAAYFLRYFPQYSELIGLVLDNLADRDINLPAEILRCGLFGSGSCPEAYGIIQFALANNLPINDFRFVSFDINAGGWEYTRHINRDKILPAFLNNGQKLLLGGHPFDITVEIPVKVNSLIPLFDIVVFQNCLNEISSKHYDLVMANLAHIFSLLKPGALMIFIELSNYISALKLLADFQITIDEANIITPIGSEFHHNASEVVNTMPDIIISNFLNNTNKLWPRRVINYYTLVLRK
ncbi:hypothetical protein GCM10007352_09090 [Mucilaginibacter phyllosphaerae]|nr:hypothetical protein GCM10007352_09090 [Mucilaginibacter phyllosphaerae]